MSIQDYFGLTEIGRGQYGTAYKATSRKDGALYCIKKIPMGNKDDQVASLREAQLLSTLDHPNIIGYKECFVDHEQALCIVTSFCEEGDVFRRIRERQQSQGLFHEKEVMDMFIQIASALLYIHSKKVLHRDLKTQNIFIARGGIMKLGDFGISKVLEKTGDFANTVTGTPYYMAPEICSSQPYTYKSDIWSLGCVLYELCTLKHAFAADSLLSLVYQIVKGSYPPIPETYSQGLSDLISYLLQRDPNTRPSLQEIFQIPYVQHHVQRYQSSEEKRMTRSVNRVAERRQEISKARDNPDEYLKDPTGDANWDALPAKEKLRLKKEAEQNKRQLELKLAAMNQRGNLHQAAELKARQMESSIMGLGSPKVGRSPAPQYSGPLSPSSSPWDSSLPNMDTMPGAPPPHFGQPSKAPSMGPGGRGGGGGMGDTVNVFQTMTFNETQEANQRKGTPPSPSPASPSPYVGGFKFGITNPGSVPALPAYQQPALVPRVSDGGGWSIEAGAGVRVSGGSSKPSSSPPMPKVHESSKGRPKNYESDYNSEYESDFEEDLEEDPQTLINERARILNHVTSLKDLGSTLPGAQHYPIPSTPSMPADKVNNAIKSNKAQVMRDKAQAQLGSYFPNVYSYLRKVRAQAVAPPEREVQERLLELVGKKKDLMQGCFTVDQLVFHETSGQAQSLSSLAAGRQSPEVVNEGRKGRGGC